MKILPFEIFNLLKLRTDRLKQFFASKKSNERKIPDLNWGGTDIRGYTMVDPTPGGRKLDLLTSVHMGGRLLEQARACAKTGKARWHINNTEQHYKPKGVKLDPQLEFIYEELGLSQIEPSEMTPPKQVI